LRVARRYPKSCWQLGGAGSVGSQSLLGIPRLAELRQRLDPERSVVIWPFETGLRPPDASIGVVIAEMWPSMLVEPEDLPPWWIRDAAQVDRSARRLRRADRSGELDQWFAPSVDDPDAVVAEEGWILGVT
ncbi:MAG: cobalamin biosynthesis protein CbiG, partial [Actinomycetota bacterium]